MKRGAEREKPGQRRETVRDLWMDVRCGEEKKGTDIVLVTTSKSEMMAWRRKHTE